MTAPIQPQGFDPQNVQHWMNVLQNAARVPKSASDYASARQVTQMALEQIRVLNNAANQAEAPQAQQGTTAGQAFLRNAGQGATAGMADEIVGRMLGASGDMNADAATALARQQLGEARYDRPFTSLAGNVAGAAVNPLMRLLGPLTQGLKPMATGATYGAVIGGTQGIGEGTDQSSRLLGGALGATLGGAAGAVGGYVVGKVGKPIQVIYRNLKGAFSRTERAVTKTLGNAASPETVSQVAEGAHRAFLQKQGYPPHIIEQLIATWRAGGKTPVAPVAPIARPGETIAPSPRPIPDPLDQPAYMRGGNPRNLPAVRGRDLGKGETLPYYPRGGSVEQGMAPRPATSPTPGVQDQSTVFAQWLKGATPQDLPDRLATMRALGVNLPANAEAELLALLGPR